MSYEPAYDDLELDVAPTGADAKTQKTLDADQAKREKANREHKDPKQGNATIVNQNVVGKYEKAGEGEAPGEVHFSDLMIQQTDYHGGEGRLPRMMNGHNQNIPAVRSTLRAMGRLKDLDSAGAKLDPAELKADPKLAQKFHHLPDTGEKDSRSKFNAWSNAVTDEENEQASLAAGRAQLRAAVTGYHGAQLKLRARAKNAELDGKNSEKAAIDEKIATLHKIVDTVESAVSIVGTVEGAMLSTRGVSDLETIENGENLGATQSKTQKITEGAVKGAEFLHAHADTVKKWVNGAGFTLDNILMIGTGDFKNYAALMDAIKKLTGEIAQLGFDAETKEIEAATQQFDGMKLEMGVRVKKVKSKQEEARAGAHDFGDQVAGSDGVMAMYAAQTYQDLAFFGSDVQAHRNQSINNRLPWLHGYLNDDGHIKRSQAMGYYDDMRKAASFYEDQTEQQHFFTGHVSTWKSKAAAWNTFFEEMTGGKVNRNK